MVDFIKISNNQFFPIFSSFCSPSLELLIAKWGIRRLTSGERLFKGTTVSKIGLA